jgi:hypothetical protein
VPASRDVEQLYEAPLPEFVRARNALAARLRKTGRGAEAGHVERLSKPTVPIWIVNQLARRNPDAVARLVRSVERLKRAQLGNREPLGPATEEQRAALHALLERAEDVARSAGVKASPAVMRRVSATLLGAATDRHGSEELRRGRLTSERQAPGFEAFTGAGPSPPLRLVRPPDRRGGATTAPSAPSRASDAGVRRQREAASAARAAARERERRAVVLERDAERKRAAARTAADSVDELRARFRELQRRADTERHAADEAAEQARAAREQATAAAAQAKEAEDRLAASTAALAPSERRRRTR